jgi:peptidoglycan/xylan/chitin deacetylase (PgdA/CDA1 family)
MFNSIKLIISFILLTHNSHLVNSNIYDKCINDKHASLTFDDGIHVNTINYVNMLNKYNVSGTFFINGSIKKYKCL